MENERTGYRKDESGAVLVIVVVVLSLLFQFAALAVDMGLGYNGQRAIQNYADAATMAGTLSLWDDNPTSTDAAQAVAAATQIGTANGLANSEMLSVQAGHWDDSTDTFTPDTTPYNAVKMVAERRINSVFAKIMNVMELDPRVTSIAVRTTMSRTNCLVPFGVQLATLQGFTIGDVITIRADEIGDAAHPGNWGKLDIGGNMSSGSTFLPAFLSGQCSTEVSVGDQITPGTGTARVDDGFAGRISAGNTRLMMAVVDAFGNGNASVTVVGFIYLDIISEQGNGQNWTAQLRILDGGDASAGGGPITPTNPKVRLLPSCPSRISSTATILAL